MFFDEKWESEYFPPLRCVEEVSSDLLTPVEARSIEQLRRIDPDDLPSATLALVFGACFLSQDRAPLACVYGPALDYKGHCDWLRGLQANGGASATLAVFATVALGPILVGQGVVNAARALYLKNPWWLLGGAAALLVASVLAWRRYWDDDVRDSLLGEFEALSAIIAEGSDFLTECRSTFEKLLPVTPDPKTLATNLTPTQLVTRQCLYDLAREPRGNLSAKEIYEIIPLAVKGQHNTLRQILRGSPCFAEVGRGRWQVGRPV